MSEADITRQIMDYLKLRGAFVAKLLGHLGQRRGLPDISAVYRGRAVWIEVKTPKGKPTPRQEEEIAAIIRAGGRAIIARCIEDVAAILDEIDKEVSE